MEAEVYLIVDNEGSCVVALDLAAAHELANDENLEPTRRVIVLNVKLPLPECVLVEVTLPPEGNEATVKVS